MNKWIQEVDPAVAVELMEKSVIEGNSVSFDIFYIIWLTEVDRIISNDGLGDNHAELPDWGWEEAYSVSDLTPQEAVNSYLIDQTNSLLESFTAFSD